MSFKTTGIIHLIEPAVQVSDKFTKRLFVITQADNPEYPQLISFELTNKRVGQIDGYNVGDAVTVEFQLRGREWTSPKGEVKYFNTLNAWQVDRANAQAQPPAQPMEQIPF